MQTPELHLRCAVPVVVVVQAPHLAMEAVAMAEMVSNRVVVLEVVVVATMEHRAVLAELVVMAS